MFSLHLRQKKTSSLLLLPMLRVIPWWTTDSDSLPESQPLRFGALVEDIPQSFVWSGTACMGETRKHSFPNAWDMGPPTSLKVPGKPSGLLAALASLSLTFCLEILVWTWSLSLSDGFAKTGTHLQIITVHPKMHSTVSKKKNTRLLVSEICYPELTVLFHCHDWKTDPSEHSTQCKKYYSSENFNRTIICAAILNSWNLQSTG